MEILEGSLGTICCLLLTKIVQPCIQSSTHRYALVLELVDRHDSGSCVRKDVGVQVSPGALKILPLFSLIEDHLSLARANYPQKMILLTLLENGGVR